MFKKTKIARIDSRILTKAADEQYVVKELVNEKKLRLVYRGSEDGFGAADFHRKCDNKGATISVIETTDGEIVGGYASVPWKSEGGF